MELRNPDQLAVIKTPEGEWCVTLDGRAVVKFAGSEARERAERYMTDLRRIAATGQVPRDPGSSQVDR